MANEAVVLVGIDVGMTCTGVSWAVRNRSMQMADPHVIQNWPGNAGTQSNKVPTTVGYSNGVLSCWGFLAAHAQEDPENPLDAHDWFKIFLDPEEYQRARGQGIDNVPKSHDDVRKWYRDFLKKLHAEIEKQLEGRIGNSWSRANIEFLFSVPTTWTAIGVTKDFEKLVSEAGFGRGGPHHSVSVSLTEAEAAAVHTFKAGAVSYSDGDVILIVDAGGGTTDLALLKARVPSQPGQRAKLEQLDCVQGDEIGSVLIDLDFEKLAYARLKVVQNRLRRDAADVAWDMMRKNFQGIKHEFGTEHSDFQRLKQVQVPGLGEDFDASDAGIRNGQMRFSNADIETLFDKQLRKIYNIVDHQMNRMGKVMRDGQITHMVLSGGLGSSEYIKRKLKERYINTPTRNPFAQNLLIVTSDAPQLAVVKGLVQDRIQQLESGPVNAGVGVLATRICRISLGVICFQKYNEAVHRGQPMIQDPIDGQRYVKDRISWFIKQGQSISDEAISHPFYRNLKKNGPAREPWVDKIAISHTLKHLPSAMNEDGAKELCKMKSDLTTIPLDSFVKKKKSWWQFWKNYKTYYRADYQIKFRMKPAGVEFELWYNGKRFDDGKTRQFEVEWEEGAKVSSPREYRHSSHDASRWDR